MPDERPILTPCHITILPNIYENSSNIVIFWRPVDA